MPVNRAVGVGPLMETCRRYFEATGRRISYEYAMIDGVNDVYQREKPHHVVKIVQRLPNPHQHDVGDFRPAVLLGKGDPVPAEAGEQGGGSGAADGDLPEVL